MDEMVPSPKSTVQEEDEEYALSDNTLEGAQVEKAAEEEKPRLGSTVQEEDEEGALSDYTLERAQVEKAAEEEKPRLGVEEDQIKEHTVSKTRKITTGTLEKLVENLITSFEDNDFTYVNTFLSTYRAFTSAKEVLELLLDSATASILRAWLDQCSEDFREPPNYPCLLKMLDYLKKNISGSDPERRAQNLLEQFQNQEVENDDEFHNTSPSNQCDEEEPEISSPEEFSSFQEHLVAEQLTYMDAELFKKVVPHHCLGCIWSQRHKEENKHVAPTIRATISQFNAVTKCVVSTILNSKELKTQQRAKIMEKWIRIAHVKHLF
ncbi:ral guanine nucleotide dissociation stimulator-like 1 [Strigops habroptila]|uniref:ral guanine nucleotide dissociation stimulator-like 1 n=1 Tax=Strigops habroptila TaxID=2489341 RepID=UPI0011CF8EA7|nr:ral guanine nucleotide dissociation stimulator-like 1 [Strigops habroptila]